MLIGAYDPMVCPIHGAHSGTPRLAALAYADQILSGLTITGTVSPGTGPDCADSGVCTFLRDMFSSPVMIVRQLRQSIFGDHLSRISPLCAALPPHAVRCAP